MARRFLSANARQAGCAEGGNGYRSQAGAYHLTISFRLANRYDESVFANIEQTSSPSQGKQAEELKPKPWASTLFPAEAKFP